MGLQSTCEMKIPDRLAGSPPMKMGCEPYRGRGQLVFSEQPEHQWELTSRDGVRSNVPSGSPLRRLSQ